MKKRRRMLASIMAYKKPGMEEPLIVLENRTVKRKKQEGEDEKGGPGRRKP